VGVGVLEQAVLPAGARRTQRWALQRAQRRQQGAGIASGRQGDERQLGVGARVRATPAGRGAVVWIGRVVVDVGRGEQVVGDRLDRVAAHAGGGQGYRGVGSQAVVRRRAVEGEDQVVAV